MKFLIIIFTLIPLTANAGFYLEPYIGYSTGVGSSSYGSSTEYKHDFSGQLFGARVGYFGRSFFSGFDYSISNAKLNTTSDSLSAEDEISINHLNLIVGKLLGRWKLWFGVILTSELKGLDSSDPSDQFVNADQNFESGGGFLAGFSYYLARNIQLNFEYRIWDYETANINGQYVSSFDLLELNQSIVFISFPLGR